MPLLQAATPNTLRLMVLSDPNDGPQIVAGFMRFGASGSGMVDNAGAGTQPDADAGLEAVDLIHEGSDPLELPLILRPEELLNEIQHVSA